MKTPKKRQNANYRMFHGMPVRDGTSSIRVQPNKTDIKKAVPGDPTHCAYAECLRRQWSAPNVWIFKTVAYVQLLDENGSAVIERYAIHEEARWYLDRFDNGDEVHPAGFVLTPPNMTAKLDNITAARRRASAELRARGEVRKPARKAEIVGTKKNVGAGAEPRELISITRSGVGMVHFRSNKEIQTIRTRT